MFLFKNNAFGTLASPVAPGDTTIYLLSGHGARFPTPTGGDLFKATLILTDSNGQEVDWEIVHCSGKSTDQLTVIRAQEGSVALSVPAGGRIEMRGTKELFEYFRNGFVSTIAVQDGSTNLPNPGGYAMAWNTFNGTPAYWDGTVWRYSATRKGATNCATLSSERVTNGTFTGAATGWTLGSGWAYSTNNVVCTLSGGAEGTLSQNIPISDADIYCLIEWKQTHSETQNGRITPVLDGTAGVGTICANTTQAIMQQVIKSNAIYPHTIAFQVTDLTSSGTITIDDVSVKEITQVMAAALLLDADGNTQVEERIVKTSSGLNTIYGAEAGANILTDAYSIALFGNKAGKNITTGHSLVGVGHNAIQKITNGYSIVAVGQAAFLNAQSAYESVAIGASAGREFVNGQRVVCLGFDAGRYTTSGANNQSSINSIFIGADARPSASNNTNEIVIGEGARGGGSNTATYGNASTTTHIFNGSVQRLTTSKTPSSATDTGTAGDACWDANYFYICVATNTWRRAAHATW